MKTNFFKLALIVMFITANASSCIEEQDPNSLPKATQTGNGTFGCYVNGELFIPARPTWDSPSKIIHYNRTTKVLTISCIGKNSDMRSITFTVKNPEKNKKVVLDSIIYDTAQSYLLPDTTFSDGTIRYYRARVRYKGKNIGEIVLKRFDLDNKIVSGVFSCKEIPLFIGNELVKDSVCNITEGRFDLLIGKIID